MPDLNDSLYLMLKKLLPGITYNKDQDDTVSQAAKLPRTMPLFILSDTTMFSHTSPNLREFHYYFWLPKAILPPGSSFC